MKLVYLGEKIEKREAPTKSGDAAALKIPIE